MTRVEERMENHLNTYLTWEEIEEAMPVIVKQLSNADYATLKYNHNPEKPVPVKDCWDKDVDGFTIISIDNLFRLVRHHAFEWCILKMRSMK